MRHIAIIGAGITGLVLALELQRQGDCQVTVFEKSRGLGGRLSTRRADSHSFDHGAPFFTARSPAFKQFLSPYIADGTIADWQPRVLTLAPGVQPSGRPWFEPHYVGVPQMNSLCKVLAQDLVVHTGVTVTGITGQPGRWLLQTELPERFLGTEERFGPFHWVVTAVPAAQAGQLLPSLVTPDVLAQVAFEPCFSLQLPYSAVGQLAAGKRHDGRLPFDAAVVQHSPLAWLGFNQHKPGRGPAGSLVAQSTGEWALQHLATPLPEVQQLLLTALVQLMGPQALAGLDAEAVSLHRWRYARAIKPLRQACLADAAAGLGACGDWCSSGDVEGRGVEGGYRSGVAMATLMATR